MFLPSSVMCYSMVWAGCSLPVSVHAVMENCVFAIISHVFLAWCGLGAVSVSVCMLLWRIVFLSSSVMCF